MQNIRGFFQTKTVSIILYVMGLSLLLGLSVWQYQRGIEKQTIAAASEQASEQVLSASPTDWEEYVYRKSYIEGRWLDSRSFILENRVFKQRVGFEVFTPFRLSNDKNWLLVNRGWVATVEEVALPVISDRDRLAGVLYLPEKGVAIGEAVLPDVASSDQWPKKSLYIDLEAMSEVLGMQIEPVVLVLDDTDPSAFVRIWKAAVLPAAKHFGYAFQWFGLAITFLIYGVIWFRRRVR